MGKNHANKQQKPSFLKRAWDFFRRFFRALAFWRRKGPDVDDEIRAGLYAAAHVAKRVDGYNMSSASVKRIAVNELRHAGRAEAADTLDRSGYGLSRRERRARAAELRRLARRLRKGK